MERGRSPTREEELQASQALLLLGAAVEGPVPSAHVQVDVVPNLDAFRAGRISEKKALRALLPLPRPAHLCPNIDLDGYKVSREAWAKAFLQQDMAHSAGILFKALFSKEEISTRTLSGRDCTPKLDSKKIKAILHAVGWMKRKDQDPYSFNSTEELGHLTEAEKGYLERKLFSDQRYYMKRCLKARDKAVATAPAPSAQINSPDLAPVNQAPVAPPLLLQHPNSK